MVAWLLAAGAELDVRDDNGCSALLTLSLSLSRSRSRSRSLSRSLSLTLILTLTPTLTRCTALHLACLRAEPTIATTCTRQLLAAGAEVDSLTASGMTPLMMACHRGNAYCVEQLLRARADCTAATPDGVMTPLRIAQCGGHGEPSP